MVAVSCVFVVCVFVIGFVSWLPRSSCFCSALVTVASKVTPVGRGSHPHTHTHAHTNASLWEHSCRRWLRGYWVVVVVLFVCFLSLATK